MHIHAPVSAVFLALLVACGSSSNEPADATLDRNTTSDTTTQDSVVADTRTDTQPFDSASSDTRIADGTTDTRTDGAADSSGADATSNGHPLCAQIANAQCSTPSECAYGTRSPVLAGDSCPNGGGTGARCCIAANVPRVAEPCCRCGQMSSRALWDSVQGVWECEGNNCSQSQGQCQR